MQFLLTTWESQILRSKKCNTLTKHPQHHTPKCENEKKRKTHKKKRWIFREGKRGTDTRSLEPSFLLSMYRFRRAAALNRKQSLYPSMILQNSWQEALERTPRKKLQMPFFETEGLVILNAVWNGWRHGKLLYKCSILQWCVKPYDIDVSLDSISGFYIFLEILAKSSSVSTLHKTLP